MGDTLDDLTSWMEEARRAAQEWRDTNATGTRVRPRVVEARRRICLVVTDGGEWQVVDHGGWTETVGGYVNRYTSANICDGDEHWTRDEKRARAIYLLESGEVDREALIALVVANIDSLTESA